MPTLEELNAMLADPGFQERHKEFERQMYERLEPLGNAIQKMMKPTPPSRQDPDLMTEEELSAAFEAMPLPARQEAMKRALDEEMGPVAVMSPTSGVTSIPLGSPWPPLSREQVAELHQELVEFYAGMKRCVDLGINDSAKAAYAERLTIVLHRLGIGSPPPTRTWTHEEVAKVAEEVQQRSGLPRHAEGRAPTTATELAITAALESSQSLSREQVEELLQSTADVPRRQEGRWEEPPKRNCYTCRWHPKDGCEVKPFTKEVIHWLRDADRDQPHGLMLPTADGCPGWEPKIVRHNCMGCAWRLEPNGEYPLGACLLPYSHAHREAKSAWLNSEAARVLPCPARKEVNPSDAVASLERWMKGGTL